MVYPFSDHINANFGESRSDGESSRRTITVPREFLEKDGWKGNGEETEGSSSSRVRSEGLERQETELGSLTFRLRQVSRQSNIRSR